MSTKSIKAILSRAVSDPRFAELVVRETDWALAGYDLTIEEVAEFKGPSRPAFEILAMPASGVRESLVGMVGGDRNGASLKVRE